MKTSGKPQPDSPKIISRAEHTVSRDAVSPGALKVLYRLHKAGYQAFLVGGCVRDILIDLHPKDFDVATDATPDEVRALFNNCRLIGRRFRLAHVRFGREVIEVATFRAAASEHNDDVAHDHEGRILRDNVYGSIEDDVWRRDFTCNALYYNIADFSVWDYVDGVHDIDQRRLVFIGDPDRRLREDPVRMLRAIRFAAKLNFTIDSSVAEAIHRHKSLLTNVPAARLFDEFLKLFQGGHAETTFALLRQFDLFAELFPATDQELDEDPDFSEFVVAALRNTDRRVADGQSVTPMFLLGVFFWVPVQRIAAKLHDDEDLSESQAIVLAAQEIVAAQQRRISIPKRFTIPMREMLALQPRFDQTKGRRATKLLEHRRFRAAYDFMLLRSEVGQFDKELAKFWTDIQTRDADERQSMLLPEGDAPRKRRRRRRNKKGAASDSS